MYSCGTPQARSDLRTEALTSQNYGLQNYGNYGLQKHLLCCCDKSQSAEAVSEATRVLCVVAQPAATTEQARSYPSQVENITVGLNLMPELGIG